MAKKPIINSRTLPLFWMVSMVMIIGIVGIMFESSSFQRGNFYGQAGAMPCQDSDGNDPFVRGLVIDRARIPHYDECLDDVIVKETVCTNGEIQMIPVPCRNSCVDGACR